MAISSADYRHAPASGMRQLLRELTLPSVFTAAVVAAPDEVAVRDDAGERTWREWRAEAEEMSCALQASGVRPGDVVAAQLPNSWEFLVCHVAVAAVGGVLMPLHEGYGHAEVVALVERAEPVVVVLGNAHDGLAQKLRTGSSSVRRVFVVDGASDEDGTRSLSSVRTEFAGGLPSRVEVRPDDPFVLLPSSGTTSAQPKICVHSHAGLLTNAAAVAADRETGVLLSASPFSHLFGLLSVHLSLLTRTCQVVVSSWDAARVAAAASTGVDELFAVPAQLWDLLSLQERDGATRLKVRVVRTGGAAVSPRLVAGVRRVFGAQVRVQWGMSEVGAGLVTPPGEPATDRDVGYPLPGSYVRVVDDFGKPCPPDVTGELQYLGPWLFCGYHRNPHLTSQVITPDGWLRTGDLATLREDGRVVFAGRAAELINVGGQKFSALEVEEAVRDLCGVSSAVVGLPDDRIGEYPCLVLTEDDARRTSLDDVVDHLRAAGFAEYKVPLDLRVVEALPATLTGKLRRRLLAELVLEGPSTSATSSTSSTDTLWLVRECTARMLGLDGAAGVPPHSTFKDMGVSSSAAVRLSRELATATGRPVSSTAAFDHPTPTALAAFLDGTAHEPAHRKRPMANDPVVVVGMACRLPGGINGPDELWQALWEGRDLVTEVPDRGWDLDALYSEEQGLPGRSYVRRGAFLDDIAGFDHEFFGISKREAATMDPQHRLLLEVVWEALENAGVRADSLRGSDTGVFVGCMPGDYGPKLHESPESFDGTMIIGTASSMASGRPAYLLGTHGPALSVDTACSSSLVALHLAVRSIERGECDAAVVGGVTVMSTPASFVDFSRQRVLSPTGRCRPFAAEADGVGWSEGVAAVFVERLSTARRANRPVLAVVRGSAINQDGPSNGLTAPNGPAQKRVIRAALAEAKLTPEQVDVVEAHGTGTPVGDPIEANALLSVHRGRKRPLLVSSVKSVLGHTQAACGLVSVMATVLGMRQGTVPATRNVDVPTPAVDWTSGPLSLVTENAAWPSGVGPRRAGISAFGLSGTNAHVILELPAPEPPPAAHDGNAAPWPVSAHTAAALRAVASRLSTTLTAQPGARSADVAAALVHTRVHFAHRAVVLAGGDQRSALAAFAEGDPSDGVVSGVATASARVVFVFPGQGSQWPGMARDLMASSEVFAKSIAECERALAPHVTYSLSEVLTEADPALLDRIEVVQPVLFAVMVSLARLWSHHGVRPAAVVGHSQGEIAAAHVAGGLTLADAARIVAVRSKLLTAIVGQGATLFVPMARTDVEQLLTRFTGRLAVAAVNGPMAVVVSGDSDAAAELHAHLVSEGVAAKEIFSVAAHSAHVDVLRDEMCAVLSGVRPHRGSIPLYSTTAGRWCDTAEFTAEHWYRNLREPVGFADAVSALARSGHTTFVEISPHPVLTYAVEQTADEIGAAAVVLGTLRRHRGTTADFVRAVATAYTRGVPVRWDSLIGGDPRAMSLPNYPFQRTRHWWGEASGTSATRIEAEVPSDLSGMQALVLAAAAAVSGNADVADLPDDVSFAELGFTSLASVELRDRLAAALGTRLPATVVMEHRTPANLARHLLDRCEGVAPDPVLPSGFEAVYRRLCAAGRTTAAAEMIREPAALRSTFTASSPRARDGVWLAESSLDPVLVCLPSIVPSGGVDEYVALGREMAGTAVLSVPLPGFDEGEPLPADLGALCASLHTSITRATSGRPYVLCGHSSGGWLAHLLAETASHRPHGVVLLDSPWPAPGFVREEVPRWLHRFVERENASGITEVGITRLTATGGYLRLLEEWQPVPLDLPVLHLSAEEDAQTWPGADAGEPVPGDHFTMMDAHVATVAERILTWLGDVRP